MCSTDNNSNSNNLQPGERSLGIVYPIHQRLLSLKNAAKYLDREEDSLRCLIYAGELPCLQESERSKIWLDKRDLDNWVDKKKHYVGRPHDER